MTAAVSEVAHEIEAYRHQAAVIQEMVQRNVEGITHEESLVQPQPAGNCLNWVLGHLLATHNSMLPLFEQEPVVEPTTLARYDRGTPPLRNPEEAMPILELTSRWEETAERIDAELANLTAEWLARPAPYSPADDPDETVRSLLAGILIHQAYHAGQLGILRRVAGKEGAIR